MSLTLLDWRRQVHRLYAEIRRDPNAETAHRLFVRIRDELFGRHPQSPLLPSARRDFRGLVYGAYDPTARFEVDIDTDVEPIEFSTATGTDGVVRYRRLGQVHLFEDESLDVWWLKSYGGGVFIPFSDPHPDTYGGGRYVIDTVKGADLGGEIDLATGKGTLVVDLNFSYNPSCAYDPMWACPLAPAGNRLKRFVDAGEHIPPSSIED